MLTPTNDPKIEWARCAASPVYFVMHYCQIYDGETKRWIPFELWVEQIQTLILFHEHQEVIALKARQLGLSWLAICYGLWQMLFRPTAVVLIFSRREDEAIYLLSDERMKGVYSRLPSWIKNAIPSTVSSAKTWALANGSTARAFPTTGGDSYTATLAIVDEADIVPDLDKMLRAIKPTIDNGGKLFLISRVDKSRPNTAFKAVYRAAKAGRNSFAHIFLPWHVRPGRTKAWFERINREIFERTGSYDERKEQYPSTDVEALEPNELNKRIPPAWLSQCYQEAVYNNPYQTDFGDSLRVFKPPHHERSYVIGADCAEGLPSSDDSTSIVLDDKGEQVAVLQGKLTPTRHAVLTKRLSAIYNNAQIMVENNNHGHAFIGWYEHSGNQRLLMKGHNDKVGWTSNSLGKTLMYDKGAQHAHDADIVIHDMETLHQLQSIEQSTLRAPEQEHDDLADAYVLALCGLPEIRKRAKAPRRAKATGLYKSQENRVRERP